MLGRNSVTPKTRKRLKGKRKRTESQYEFSCRFCEAGFKTEDELKDHNESLHVECDICSAVFNRKFHLKKHMKEEHADVQGKVKCDYCSKEFSSLMSRWLHVKSVHKNNWKFKCPDCDYGTTHPTLFENHRAKHLEPSNLKCNVCDIVFKSKLRYDLHNKIHEKSLQCPVCKKSFNKRKNMLRHINRNHGEKKERNVPCEKCHKMFFDKWSLRVHMEVHSNVKEQCPYCSYSTCHPKNLKAHVKHHVQEYDFVCESCGRGFVYNFMLRDHVLKEHGEGFPRIPCDVCNKTFATQQYLNIHKQSHEDGYLERNHQCEICGKKFLTRSMLLRHIRGHNKIYHYECQFCNKVLSCLATLKDHEKIHTGEKPYICEICGKSFGAKQYLVTHVRTHTNERPFSCIDCGQSFSQRGTLSMHQRSHHNKRNKSEDVILPVT